MTTVATILLRRSPTTAAAAAAAAASRLGGSATRAAVAARVSFSTSPRARAEQLASKDASPTATARKVSEPIVPSRDPVAFPSTGNFQDDLTTSGSATAATAAADANRAAGGAYVDLSISYHGASMEPFPKEANEILLSPIPLTDIEIKPDGMIYLPEIKYRRILNRAFGPGGWGLVPRGPHTIGTKTISREYALFCLGRFVSVARGEQDYFGSSDGLPTASEGCKSNALMRCCKDLGIASELWDPAFIRSFKDQHCVQVWASTNTGGKKLLWRRKDRTLDYPYKEDTPTRK